MTALPGSTNEELTVETVRAVLIEQFPELTFTTVHFLDEGWDSWVFGVDDAWIFRFPKRDEVVDDLRVEIALLPHLATALPAAIPEFRFIGAPGERFGRTFVGYRKITGVPASEISLDNLLVTDTPRQIAAFLTALHAFPIDRAETCGVTVDDVDELEQSILRARRQFETLAPNLTPTLRDTCARYLASDLHPTRIPTNDRVLLHNDLMVDHLLLDPATLRLGGVIDWGDLTVGDRTIDFVGLYTWGGPRLLDAVLAGYEGAEDSRSFMRVRLRTVLLAILDLHYGYKVGHDEFIGRGLRTLESALL